MREILAAAMLVLFVFTFSAIVNISNENLAVELAEKYSNEREAGNATSQLYGYFRGEAEMPSEFNEAEAKHMQDVKQVFNYLYIATGWLLLFTAIFLYFSNAQKAFLTAGIISAGILSLTALLPFDTLFTQMHQAFFPQGGWMFPADSTIIKYYPQQFFSHYATIIGITSLVFSLLILIIALFQKIYVRQCKNLKKK